MRLPKNHQHLVIVKVREQALWCRSHTKYLTLAVKSGRNKGGCTLSAFQGFLEHLSMDIKTMKQKQQELQELQALENTESPVEAPKGKRPRHLQLPDDLQDIVGMILTQLLDHPRCANASFQVSRSEIVVWRQAPTGPTGPGRSCMSWRVKGLKKRRGLDHHQCCGKPAHQCRRRRRLAGMR